MTISRVEPRLQSTTVKPDVRQSVPAIVIAPMAPIAVASVADHSLLERLAYLKTIAELADPMQSEIVKGWLQGGLRAPT